MHTNTLQSQILELEWCNVPLSYKRFSRVSYPVWIIFIIVIQSFWSKLNPAGALLPQSWAQFRLIYFLATEKQENNLALLNLTYIIIIDRRHKRIILFSVLYNFNSSYKIFSFLFSSADHVKMLVKLFSLYI